MEFRFDVGKIIKEEIVCVDNSLIISSWKSATRNRLEYQQLYEIINAIGEASSFAQSLNRVITTADKLQNSDHILYLMKEEEPQNGRTVMVGMLKIGRKKLFLLDPNQVTKEVAPLCVLDFYIHESRQRRGYGRRLFDFMLKHQNVDPGHMAVDKPSEKFLGFLKKHYKLHNQIPQINNFVVYTSFFMDRPVHSEEAALTYVSRSNRSSRTASPDGSASSGGAADNRKPSSAQYAGKPSRSRESSMSDILHGRQDRHTVSARLNPRYQSTLEWMRGNSGSGDPVYYSRTPSHSGTPLSRTPRDASPRGSQPSTPPKMYSRGGSRKHSIEILDGVDGLSASIAPTPATSPEKAPVNETHPKQVENGEETPVEIVNGKIEQMTLRDTPSESSPGKTGGWRDSVSRSSEGLVEHMSTAKGTTMTGVLTDNDSVHGHLKFHHHALW